MQTIKVLYLFGFSIRIGGHFKSALAFAKNMPRPGFQTLVAAPGIAPEMLEAYRQAGAAYVPAPLLAKRSRLPLPLAAGQIISLCRRHGIDIIHAQDFHCLSSGYLAAIILKKAFVFTKAGGPANENFPPAGIQSIFYSQELAAGMAERYGLNRNNISIISARIDLETFRDAPPTASFLSRYGLPGAPGKKLVMAIRLDQDKKCWLDALLQFAGHAARERLPVSIIIAGEGNLQDFMRQEALRINRLSGGGPLVFLPGPILLPGELNELYNYADIILGNGRSILEAMACGKPAVILGERGEAALVGPDTIEEIAWYNFSGRHFRLERNRPDISFTELMNRLLRHPELLRAVAERNYQYMQSSMDTRIGAEQLASVYEKALAGKPALFDYLRWTLKIIFDRARKSLNKKGVEQ